MLYEVVHAVLPPAAKLIWRPHVEGLENKIGRAHV